MNYTISPALQRAELSTAALGEDLPLNPDMVKAALRQLSGKDMAQAFEWYEKVVTRCVEDLKRVYDAGKFRFDASAAIVAVNRPQTLLAATAAMDQRYGSQELLSAFPQRSTVIKKQVEQIYRYLAGMSSWSAEVVEIRNAFALKQSQAIAAGDLESPYVGPGLRKREIELAYENKGTGLDTSREQKIRDTYNYNGTLKATGGIPEERLDPAARIAFLHEHFRQMDVEVPEGYLPTEEQTQRYIRALESTGAATPLSTVEAQGLSQGGGIGAGTIVAVAAAGLVAFFALRG